MTPDIIIFEKSFLQRIEEYKDILLSCDKILPSPQVRNEWSYVIDRVLEPMGWQAVWNISRKKCEDLGISFPSVVFVMVQSIDADTLTARVEVLDMPEGFHIPKQNEVSLVNLFPTTKQENAILYIRETADCLDKLRFFYEYLWQPWDLDDDDKQDWLSTHLERRLKLYYDMMSGSMPQEMVMHIKCLLQEARLLQHTIEMLEYQMGEDDENIDENIVCTLMDHHNRMDQIKDEFVMHEEPHTRTLLIMRKQQRYSIMKPSGANGRCSVFIIWPGGTLDGYMEMLTEAKFHIGEEAFVKSLAQLQDALLQAVSGDLILLSAGTHGILGLGELEKGGSIKGMLAPETTILVPHNAGNVLINCTGGEILLENLTIDILQLQIAIAVSNVRLKLRNCHFINKSNSSTSEGLLVFNGARVEIQDCNFSGFGCAIVVHTRGEVCLISTNISTCHIGIKVLDGGKLNLRKSTVHKCADYGIKVEIHKQYCAINHKVGSLGLLNDLGEVVVTDSAVHSNAKGDVCVIQTNLDIGCDSDTPIINFVMSNQEHSNPQEEIVKPLNIDEIATPVLLTNRGGAGDSVKEKQAAREVEQCEVKLEQGRNTLKKIDVCSKQTGFQAPCSGLQTLQARFSDFKAIYEPFSDEKCTLMQLLSRHEELLYALLELLMLVESNPEYKIMLINLFNSPQKEHENMLLNRGKINTQFAEFQQSLKSHDQVCQLESIYKQVEQELVSSYQNKMNHFSVLLQNAQAKIKDFSQQQQAVQGQVAYYQCEVAELSTQIQQLSEEKEKLENSTKTELCKLESHCLSLQQEKLRLISDLQATRKVVVDLQDQCQHHLKDKHQLKDDLLKTQSQFGNVENRLTELKNALNEERRLHEEDIADWKRFQNDLLLTVRLVNDLKTEAEEEWQKLVLEYKSLKNYAQNLEEQLKDQISTYTMSTGFSCNMGFLMQGHNMDTHRSIKSFIVDIENTIKEVK